MLQNINSVDRVLRLIVGAGLLSLVFIGPKTPLGYVGLILIITSFIDFCPIYRVLGISTAKGKVEN